jgi:protein-L-isoaspartate(D-aspartate) O-methyltransferase
MNDANERMLREQIIARGVSDPRVLEAFRSVPREQFVPRPLQYAAYEDSPLPLIHGQTISQPYIVALMTETLRLNGEEKVLEIGTGSGYQTAILTRLARIVYSAEIEPELSRAAAEKLAQLAITNAVLGIGNGVEIFRDHAPFDAILSAAAPAQLPEELIDQLAEGGRCIIPIGAADMQHLWLIERKGGRVTRTRLEAVRFVPMRERA